MGGSGSRLRGVLPSANARRPIIASEKEKRVDKAGDQPLGTLPSEFRCNASGNLQRGRKQGSKKKQAGLCGSGGKMAAPTRFVSPNAEVVSKTQALMVNVAAARGLQNVLKTNLGESVTLFSARDAFRNQTRSKGVSENIRSLDLFERRRGSG